MDEEVMPQAGEILSPARAMKLAISEARKGRGFVSPNPLVGCTIVDRDHRFLSVGHHAMLGGDHAEAAALKKLGDVSLLRGAHVYVTLEPCAHQGRTPSCAKTLAPLGPASVTYAVSDPNPIAARGADILRAAGVEAREFMELDSVSLDERRAIVAAAEDVAEIFLHGVRTQEPFLAMKVAMSLDGKIAMTSGESKWITGEGARQHAQHVRAMYDAVAVGRNTFVSDDPSLNVRLEAFASRPNRAIVFDPDGSTLPAMANSNLARVRPPENVIVVTGESVDPKKNTAGVTVLTCARDAEGGFVVDALLAKLRDLGVHSVLIEGGAGTYASFIKHHRIQRIHAYVAPMIIGGLHGLGWSDGIGSEKLAESFDLVRSEREVVGADMYWTARVRAMGYCLSSGS